MLAGVRVVRGPDWKWGDQDGGYGCVGSVVPPDADNEFNTMVRWDSGEMANYRAGGVSGKFDLRIFDNAQVGVKHSNIICDHCRQSGIVGIRWKCLDCNNFDLCHACYHGGKHELSHRFTRIETSRSPGVAVPCRQGDTRCRSFGIYKGARVVRGPDWEWGNQDGNGNVGTVGVAIDAHGTYRSWLAVLWPNGSTYSYRVGHRGNLDVKYTEKDSAGDFYIDHLPVFDATKIRPYINAGDKVCLLEMGTAKLREMHSKRCLCRQDIYHLREKVGKIIKVDKDEDIQVDFGGSQHFVHPLCLFPLRQVNKEKKEESKKEEKQKRDEKENTEERTTHFSPDKARTQKNRLGAVKPGDKVRLKEMDLAVVKLIQEHSCGWHEQIPDLVGKVGNVIMIDKDGDVSVDFGEVSVFLNPSCLDKVKESTSSVGGGSSSPARTLKNRPVPVKPGDKARLIEMDLDEIRKQQEQSCGWHEQIPKFVGKVGKVIMIDKDGDIKVDFGEVSIFLNPLCLDKVEESASKVGGTSSSPAVRPSWKFAFDYSGILPRLGPAPIVRPTSPCLSPSVGGEALFNAAAEGNTAKVREIIRSNHDSVKFQNSEGQTPMHAAALHGHVDAIKALILGNASLEQGDEDGDSALSCAVIGGKPDIVSLLLFTGSNINASNKKGLTPLHLAADRGQQACAEVLLKHEQRCDVNYKDNDGNTPLFLAITKNNTSILQILLRHPRVNRSLTNNKGFNILHHAVFNNNNFAVQKILGVYPVSVNNTTNEGFTALHIAALNGFPEIVLTLVRQANCNKNAKDSDGKTPLHLAVHESKNECMTALVDSGANVNAQDNKGVTALHIVVAKASLHDFIRSTPVGQLVEQLESGGRATDEKAKLIVTAMYLINHGADIYIKDNSGMNVLDLTLNPGVQLLLTELYKSKRGSKCVIS